MTSQNNYGRNENSVKGQKESLVRVLRQFLRHSRKSFEVWALLANFASMKKRENEWSDVKY
jgi:hypothetical protein